MDRFQAYVRALAIPSDQWPKAFSTLQKTVSKEKGPDYRLRSALDYFIQGCQTENVFVRFIIMVIVAERLFSRHELNKRKRISRGIYTFTKDVDPDQIEADYAVRNDLMHGPDELHKPPEISELAARWEAACGAVLSTLLLDDRVSELQALLDEYLT
jgi:hypothetical protein